MFLRWDLIDWIVVKVEWLIFWSLGEKRISWDCLLRSELKPVFHSNTYLQNFLKLLFKWVAEVSILLTMEKKEVSSAKRGSSERLLILNKNNNSPSMVPWGTSASILLEWEICSFKTTRCFLKRGNSMIVFKMLPGMPLCLSLYDLCVIHLIKCFRYV